MKNDAQRVPRPGGHARYAMADVAAAVAVLARYGTFARREDHHLPEPRYQRLADRLGTRPLLHQQERTAAVIDVRAAEEYGELQRERNVAVQVAVQTIVTAGLVM